MDPPEAAAEAVVAAANGGISDSSRQHGKEKDVVNTEAGTGLQSPAAVGAHVTAGG